MLATVADLAAQRGKHQGNITWTKGHATLQHIFAEVDARNSIFNSYADAAADCGHRLQGNACSSDILAFFGAKQKAYVKVVRAILRRIARVAKEANTRLEAIERDKPQLDVDTPKLVLEGGQACALRIDFINAPPLELRNENICRSPDAQTLLVHYCC